METLRTGTLIETARLTIDYANDADIDMIIDIESHPLNAPYLWIGTPQQHYDEIRDPNHLLLLFHDKGTNIRNWKPSDDGYSLVTPDVKGYALIRMNFDSNIFELRRIAITEKSQNYGIESMKALLKYAFEMTDTNRFWLDVYPDNPVGIKLYESLGMQRDGILRENYKSERGYLDQIIYSMLRSEYEKLA